MNNYFTPRTPEPRSNALGIVLGSMGCVLAVVLVGTGIWIGHGALREPVTTEEARDDRSEHLSTNQEIWSQPDAAEASRQG